MITYTCEIADCDQTTHNPECPGWLTVSYTPRMLGGRRNYHFCSMACLQTFLEWEQPQEQSSRDFLTRLTDRRGCEEPDETS